MDIEALLTQNQLPALECDSLGIICRINRRFSEVFGWTPQDLVGWPVTILIPEYLRDAHHLGFSHYVTGGHPHLLDRPLLLKVLTRDGQEVEVEQILAVERRGEDWVFAATMRPLVPPP
jgi:PAS domain S-box-containing protein